MHMLLVLAILKSPVYGYRVFKNRDFLVNGSVGLVEISSVTLSWKDNLAQA
jgi:hypothetical protein